MTGNFGEIGLWSREVEMGRGGGGGGGGAVSCSSSSCTDYGNKAASASASASAPTTFLHDMINSLSSPSASHPFFHDNSSFNDPATFAAMHHHTAAPAPAINTTTAATSGGRSDGLTRDFLGLRPLSHGDILSLTGFGSCIVPNSSNLHSQIQKPWQG